MIRDHQFETNAITASYVDRTLGNKLYNPDELIKSMGVCKHDRLTTSDGLMQLHLDKRFDSQKPLIMQKMPIQLFSSLTQNCGHLITEFCDDLDIVANSHPCLGSLFPIVKFSTYSSVYKSEYPNIYGDMRHAEQLKEDLALNIDWTTAFSDTEGKWQAVMSEHPLDVTYKVRNLRGICKSQFILIHHDNCRYSVLPVTIFRNLEFNSEFFAFTPPKPPYSFFNEHLLPLHPNAIVVISPDVIDVVHRLSDPNTVYLTNIGHDLWLDKLNYNVLKGRQVVLLDPMNMHSEYTIALIQKLKQHQISSTVSPMYPNLIY